MRVDQANEFTGHLAGQHHADHIHGFRSGDTQSALVFGLDTQGLKHLGYLRTATVHHDRVQSHLTQEHHVFGEAGFQMIVDHRVAAIFDDDALSGEFLQPRQRFDKHFRLLVGAQVGVHVEVESRSFEFFGHSYSISFRSQR